MSSRRKLDIVCVGERLTLTAPDDDDGVVSNEVVKIMLMVINGPTSLSLTFTISGLLVLCWNAFRMRARDSQMPGFVVLYFLRPCLYALNGLVYLYRYVCLRLI